MIKDKPIRVCKRKQNKFHMTVEKYMYSKVKNTVIELKIRTVPNQLISANLENFTCCTEFLTNFTIETSITSI